MAIAGPLVTLAIAAALLRHRQRSGEPRQRGRRLARSRVGSFDEGTAVFGYLRSINFFVLLFNLIPGFPLDGGRIVRAIAWWRTGDRTRATRFAARLGRGAGFVMIGIGVLMFLRGDTVGGLWLGFIGLFLSQAARSAEVQATFAGRIEGSRWPT